MFVCVCMCVSVCVWVFVCVCLPRGICIYYMRWMLMLIKFMSIHVGVFDCLFMSAVTHVCKCEALPKMSVHSSGMEVDDKDPSICPSSRSSPSKRRDTSLGSVRAGATG